MEVGAAASTLEGSLQSPEAVVTWQACHSPPPVTYNTDSSSSKTIVVTWEDVGVLHSMQASNAADIAEQQAEPHGI